MTDQKFKEVVILTGAGFSKAFGLPLAGEFNTYLSNAPRIRDNPILFKLINSEKNFEKIYSLLQKGKDNNFNDFANAVEECFDRMNLFCQKAAKQGEKVVSFKRAIQEYVYDKPDRCELYFFTLNQDILLEYLIELRDGSRGGIDLIYPGICNITKSLAGNYTYLSSPPQEQVISRANISRIDINLQNDFYEISHRQKNQKAVVNDNQSVYKILYYKLHGSSNWFDGDDKMMILGTEKDEQVLENELISMYFKEFERAIKDKILLVIGYSFNDSHVNDIISRAVKNDNTKVYYISPDANFSNEKLGDRIELIEKMFPYKLEDLLDFDSRQDGRMPFEAKEILRALSFTESSKVDGESTE
ncbi:MAG: SIR2 family protein [Gammaproteobacteria bacterium]|nr:SIR2 family protein [Gammaproteobacteria bacterium]